MNSLGNRFLWVFTFIFRQKNKRTKDSLNAQMFVQASLTCICSFNAMHLWCCVYDLFLKDKNRRGGCILKKDRRT